jgi:hypothetical protein
MPIHPQAIQLGGRNVLALTVFAVPLWSVKIPFAVRDSEVLLQMRRIVGQENF